MSGSDQTKGLSASVGAALAIAALAVLFVCVNIIASKTLRSARLDFTQNKIYTLTGAAKDMLRGLDEPIDLTFYYSRQAAETYPQVASYATRVRDLLLTFQSLSGGTLSVRVVEPEPFSPEEDEANAAGISPVQGQSGETIYFGLAGENRVDGAETIAFFAPEREAFLEYDLIQLIDKLNRPVQPKLGLLTSLPMAFGRGGPQAMMQGMSEPYQLYRMLQDRFDIETLGAELTADDLSELEVVMIAQPPSLGEAALYAIDQFVLAGGKLLVLVDPSAQLDESQAQPGMPPMGGSGDAATLEPLFEAWGVDFLSDQVVLDRARGLMLPSGGPGRRVEQPFPLWIDLEAEDLSGTDLATAELTQTIRMGGVGHVGAEDDAPLAYEPLLMTSADAMVVDAATVMFDPQPDQLLADFVATGERYVIAARFTGNAVSAFPGGDPTSAEGLNEDDALAQDETETTHLSEAANATNIVVVADTDFLDDRLFLRDNGLFLQIFADNATFVLNTIDNLMGSDGLLGLRARAPSSHPMTVVEDLRRQANARYQQREQSLQAELEDTLARITSLESARDGEDAGRFAGVTEEQQAEIARFQARSAEIRRQLRDVQRDLNSDIMALKGWLIIFTVVVPPLLLGAGAFAVARNRRKKFVQKTA